MKTSKPKQEKKTKKNPVEKNSAKPKKTKTTTISKASPEKIKTTMSKSSSKKKITVKGALRLPKDNPARIAAVKMGKEKISLSKNIKNSVKKAVKFINDFEKTAADIAISNGYDFVVCGHIHHPEMKTIKTETGQVEYLNSGDWIENLTALEYHNKQWSLYKYKAEEFVKKEMNDNEDDLVLMENEEIFHQMLGGFLQTNELVTPIKF